MSIPALPHVDLPQGSEQLRAEVRAFLAATEFEPMVDGWMAGHDARFSRLLGDRGWIGMTWPSRYGGHESSAFARFVVNEELLAAGAPVAAHWIADRQVGPALLRRGTDELRHRFLPRIARGEIGMAVGLSEPDAGSDLASVRTKAVKVDGGWNLSGRKTWTSWAHKAAAVVVLCRTEPRHEQRRHAGLSQLIVALPAVDAQISPIFTMDGQHHFNEITFDDVFVPDHMVLGRPGDGWRQVTSELALERSGAERFLSNHPLLAACADSAAGSADEFVATTAARLRLLRQASLAVADLLDQGERPEVEAALVKDLGTMFEQEVVENLLVRLPMAPDPTSDDPLCRLLAQAVLRAPTSTLRGGVTDILRGMVARQLGLR